MATVTPTYAVSGLNAQAEARARMPVRTEMTLAGIADAIMVP